MKVKKWFVLGSVFITVLILFIISFLRKSYFVTNENDVDKILQADQNFQFPPGFPPDPGEVGKKTLEGIDSDGDGLRDDLQRWIYARYPNDLEKRAALKQMAIFFQKMLNPKMTKQDARDYDKLLGRAIRCLMYRFEKDANLERRLIKTKALNTKKRTLQYIKNDAFYDGMSSPSSERIGEADCKKYE